MYSQSDIVFVKNYVDKEFASHTYVYFADGSIYCSCRATPTLPPRFVKLGVTL